ncbi:MAG: prenyltransferase/squalene oxidase repeat-containing protein [Solirubrobacterales bacterium]
MSWEAVSFLILSAGLLAGFAWYERSRPPSQVVALVAALAALAIAGRVAFAAFPNVKPTTDIVIFAGYALGPAPGFAVGALTAVVSNFWFGQGPWTPWQMAGWGLCGLLGAALALGARNCGRLTLAAVCGFGGLAYGALLNFSLMATYGGDLSFTHFLVLESRAVPFDAAHAIGNIAFALLAGPAMIRMLVRFRERFQWRASMGGALGAALLAAALLVSVPAAAHAASGTDNAARWLVSVQNEDGGWGADPGDASGTEMTGWVMLGLEAAGRNPLDVSHGGTTPVAYLRYRVDQLESSGDFARTILALEGAGVDPRSFGGRDLVSALLKRRRDDGSFEGWPATTAYAVIALRAAGAGGLEKSLSWLGSVQNKDGGWGDVPGAPSNADVTGAVMQAMPESKLARQGLSYLRQYQRDSGGFSTGGSGAVNTQSTAWAAEGMRAVGADPASVKSGGNSALDYIASQQDSDGHYRYSSSNNKTPVWVTGEVLVAAAGEALPVSVPARKPQPQPAPEESAAQPSTSPLTIPSPSSAPSTGSSAAAPSGGGGGVGPGSIAGGSGHAGPLVPEAAPPASPPGETAPGSPDGEGSNLTEATQTAAVEPAGEGGSGSPWIPIGIGLGVGAIALLAPWLLGKRYAW